MTASPISDLNPVLMAARCPLTLAAAGGIPAVWKLLMLAQQCWSLMGCQFLSYEETRGFASPPPRWNANPLQSSSGGYS